MSHSSPNISWRYLRHNRSQAAIFTSLNSFCTISYSSFCSVDFVFVFFLFVHFYSGPQDKAVGGISLFSILQVLSCTRHRCWKRSRSRLKPAARNRRETGEAVKRKACEVAAQKVTLREVPLARNSLHCTCQTCVISQRHGSIITIS